MAQQQEETRDFAAVLVELSHGATVVELSESLKELVAKVSETGKSGRMVVADVVARLGTLGLAPAVSFGVPV